jgi:hypothetical protein
MYSIRYLCLQYNNLNKIAYDIETMKNTNRTILKISFLGTIIKLLESKTNFNLKYN